MTTIVANGNGEIYTDSFRPLMNGKGNMLVCKINFTNPSSFITIGKGEGEDKAGVNHQIDVYAITGLLDYSFLSKFSSASGDLVDWLNANLTVTNRRIFYTIVCRPLNGVVKDEDGKITGYNFIVIKHYQSTGWIAELITINKGEFKSYGSGGDVIRGMGLITSTVKPLELLSYMISEKLDYYTTGYLFLSKPSSSIINHVESNDSVFNASVKQRVRADIKKYLLGLIK